jgi:hypothetical protein
MPSSLFFFFFKKKKKKEETKQGGRPPRLTKGWFGHPQAGRPQSGPGGGSATSWLTFLRLKPINGPLGFFPTLPEPHTLPHSISSASSPPPMTQSPLSIRIQTQFPI